MATGETPITIIGNLTADPELKFTDSGQALAKFTVASTPRTFDKDSGQWRDGTSTFFRCAAWRGLAEHVAESLTKGSRVVASGRLRQHNWQTPEGENRSMLAVEVDDIGASLRFTTVTVSARQQTSAPANDAWDSWGANGPAGGAARTDTEQAAAPPVGDKPPF